MTKRTELQKRIKDLENEIVKYEKIAVNAHLSGDPRSEKLEEYVMNLETQLENLESLESLVNA